MNLHNKGTCAQGLDDVVVPIAGPAPASGEPDLLLFSVMSLQCNLRCSFCYQTSFSSERTSDEILYEKLRPVYERTQFHAIVGGEITVIPGMKEYLTFLGDNYPKMTLLFGTNGVLLDDDWLDLVERYGFLVNYSLNASTAQAYQKVHPTGNYQKIYEKIYGNLLRAVERQRSSGRPLINNISMVLTEETLNDVQPFAKTAARLGLNAFFRFQVDKEMRPEILAVEQEIFKLKYFFEDFIQIQPWQNPSHIEEKAIMARCRAEFQAEKEAYLASLPFKPQKRLAEKIITYDNFVGKAGACQVIGRALAVTPSGLLCPCFNLPNYVLGDAAQGDLAAILRGPALKNITALVRSGDYRYCFPRCTVVKDPTTCRPGLTYPPPFQGEALFEQGDYEAFLAKCLENFQEEQPSANIFYKMAFACHMLKQNSQALEYYQQALEGGFTEFWVRYNRGNLLLDLGRLEEARADLMRAHELDPTHDGARQQLAATEVKPVEVKPPEEKPAEAKPQRNLLKKWVDYWRSGGKDG